MRNKPIIYEGQEFKDRLSCTTRFNPSFRMRMAMLFCTGMSIEHEVFTKEVMPDHKAIGHVHVRSIWDNVRWYFNKKKGFMTKNDQPCNSALQE